MTLQELQQHKGDFYTFIDDVIDRVEIPEQVRLNSTNPAYITVSLSNGRQRTCLLSNIAASPYDLLDAMRMQLDDIVRRIDSEIEKRQAQLREIE